MNVLQRDQDFEKEPATRAGSTWTDSAGSESCYMPCFATLSSSLSSPASIIDCT